jgi:hypothetical protein
MWSEIEGRIDSAYYTQEFKKILNNNKHKMLPIREVVETSFNGFAAGKDNQKDYGTLQIRPTNLINEELVFDKNIFVEVINNRLRLKQNDVIFNNTNSRVLIGKTVIFDKDIDATLSNHMTVLRVKKSIIIPKYLMIILNIYQKRKVFYNICTNWNNQSGINYSVLKSVRIPVPNIVEQEKIVRLYESAKHKESDLLNESRYELESIDTYLLEELGIDLPEIDNSFSARVFTTTSKEVTGSRLDPKCFSTYYAELKKELFSHANSIKLKDLLLKIKGGNWGRDLEDATNNDIKCFVLRSTEIDNKYNIKLESDRAQYRAISSSSITKMDMHIGDIIVEKSGGSIDQPVGRVIIVDSLNYNDSPITYSNFLTKLRVHKEKVNPYYLFEYLRFVYRLKLTDSMQNQTNGIRNLIMSEYKNLPVIVPYNNEEIGKEIKKKKEKAMSLEQQANDTLIQAKEQIEKIILGE